MTNYVLAPNLKPMQDLLNTTAPLLRDIPMPIYISRKAPNASPVSSARLKTIAERMLKHLSLLDCELSLLLCDDATIHELNLEHRGKDKPTDVLSFPQYEPMSSMSEYQGKPLGDIVVSIDTAEKQAKSRRHDLMEEIRFLMAHGLLHLVGYDHETDEEEKVMDLATKELVAASLQR